jgi:hypothetical protein
LLEQRGIPFTTRDYRDGFGLFTPGSAEDFGHDLNVPLLKALGFKVPAGQGVRLGAAQPRAVTSGFSIYTSGLARGIRADLYANGGRVDFPDPVSHAPGTNSVRGNRRLGRFVARAQRAIRLETGFQPGDRGRAH